MMFNNVSLKRPREEIVTPIRSQSDDGERPVKQAKIEVQVYVLVPYVPQKDLQRFVF